MRSLPLCPLALVFTPPPNLPLRFQLRIETRHSENTSYTAFLSITHPFRLNRCCLLAEQMRQTGTEGGTGGRMDRRKEGRTEGAALGSRFSRRRVSHRHVYDSDEDEYIFVAWCQSLFQEKPPEFSAGEKKNAFFVVLLLALCSVYLKESNILWHGMLRFLNRPFMNYVDVAILISKGFSRTWSWRSVWRLYPL